MVEHRPWLTFLTHAILLLGCLVIAFPIYTIFVASTHTPILFFTSRGIIITRMARYRSSVDGRFSDISSNNRPATISEPLLATRQVG